MTSDLARQTAVSCREHGVLAQQTARSMALELGFSEFDADEIVLATSELTANLLRHATNGKVIVKPIREVCRVGIEIESVDGGPGIRDVDRSLADGFSSAGGLGYGLGTVNRLMDELEIVSLAGQGTQIVARRFVQPDKDRLAAGRWDIGAATRSRRGAPENGDAFVVCETARGLLVGVIDGLGHGDPAQQAATAALQYVRKHAESPLEKVFAGVDRACRGTRGVVMALARLEDGDIDFAGIGNVGAFIVGPDRPHLMSRRDILGIHGSDARACSHKWRKGWLLVIASDGIDHRLGEAWLVGKEGERAQTLAQSIVREFALEQDDATVVVVRG